MREVYQTYIAVLARCECGYKYIVLRLLLFPTEFYGRCASNSTEPVTHLKVPGITNTTSVDFGAHWHFTMFREIFLLHSEDVSMEISSSVAMRLTRVPYKGTSTASVADIATDCSSTCVDASALSPLECEQRRTAENEVEGKLSRSFRNAKKKQNGCKSIPELLTDVSFCVSGWID